MDLRVKTNKEFYYYIFMVQCVLHGFFCSEGLVYYIIANKRNIFISTVDNVRRLGWNVPCCGWNVRRRNGPDI
jgi:hypothetical protein